MHCTYCSLSKGTFWSEAMLNSEKIKPTALAVIKLHLSKGISQSSSQSIEIYFVKVYSNLSEAIQVILKTLLGLAIPDQHCQGTCKAGFKVICLARKTQTLIYSTIVLYMIKAHTTSLIVPVFHISHLVWKVCHKSSKCTVISP